MMKQLQKSDRGQIVFWASQTCTRIRRLFVCLWPCSGSLIYRHICLMINQKTHQINPMAPEDSLLHSLPLGFLFVVFQRFVFPCWFFVFPFFSFRDLFFFAFFVFPFLSGRLVIFCLFSFFPENCFSLLVFCLFLPFLSGRLVNGTGNGYGQQSQYLVTALK